MLRKPHLLHLAALLGLSILALGLRWPAMSLEAFHNEDAAGITYNADLLLRGLLPYVDNLEWKAPGAFFIAALSWLGFGRDIVTLQQVVATWSVLAAWGVYWGGLLLYGHRAALISSLLYVLLSPITDSMDINYGAWMITPYVWATVFFIKGARSGQGRWTLASGVTLALAGLVKRQAATITPLLGLIILLGPWLRRPDGFGEAAKPQPRLKGLTLLGLGLALGFAPILVFYWSHGALEPFIKDYFLSQSGWHYVKDALPMGDRLRRLGDGFVGLRAFMAVPTIMVIFAGLSLIRRPQLTLRGLLLGGHFWLSFLGAALGMRFFKGYYLQVLPAAVWIAAHPDGLIQGWLLKPRKILRFFAEAEAEAPGPKRRRARLLRWGLAAILLAVTIPAVMRDRRSVNRIRWQRHFSRDEVAAYVGRIIERNTDEDAQIWVWGRWAWPVYHHAKRLSPTRYYKVLGLITTPLTNTWRRPGEPTRFVRRAFWQELMDDLERTRPAFIVTSQNEDFSDFTELKALLRRRYRRVRGAQTDQLTLYRREDLKLKHPPYTPPGRALERLKSKKPAKKKPKDSTKAKLKSKSREVKDERP